MCHNAGYFQRFGGTDHIQGNSCDEMDVENQALREHLTLSSEDVSDSKSHPRPYFWNRGNIYSQEMSIPFTPLPLARTINTAVVMYSIYVGFDFVYSVCKL